MYVTNVRLEQKYPPASYGGHDCHGCKSWCFILQRVNIDKSYVSLILIVLHLLALCYFWLQKYVGRGEDLLEDAHVLSESDDEEGATIRELAKNLRHQLSSFTEGLEVKRRYIEDAVRLYTMLDKVRIDWLIDQLIDWLINWLVDWLIDW